MSGYVKTELSQFAAYSVGNSLLSVLNEYFDWFGACDSRNPIMCSHAG